MLGLNLLGDRFQPSGATGSEGDIRTVRREGPSRFTSDPGTRPGDHATFPSRGSLSTIGNVHRSQGDINHGAGKDW